MPKNVCFILSFLIHSQVYNFLLNYRDGGSFARAFFVAFISVLPLANKQGSDSVWLKS
jgi:hypothetical protein